MFRWLRFVGKVVRGEQIILSPQTEEGWNRQFSRGRWDYLLATPPYNVSILTHMIRDEFHRQGKKKLRLLDVGCGNGGLLQEIWSENIDYTGTDISETALKKIHEKYPNVNLVKSTMEELDLEETKFDVIVFSESLYYAKYKYVIDRYSTLLRDDGVFIISMYSAWRTSFIWLDIKSRLKVLQSVYLKNKSLGVAWRVKKCQYRKQ